MAKKQGNQYSARFKFDVVVETLSSQNHDAEVARKYGIHPVTLSAWKKQFLEQGDQVFSNRKAESDQQR